MLSLLVKGQAEKSGFPETVSLDKSLKQHASTFETRQCVPVDETQLLQQTFFSEMLVFMILIKLGQ